MLKDLGINWSAVSDFGLKTLFRGAVAGIPALILYTMPYSAYMVEDGELNVVINNEEVQYINDGITGNIHWAIWPRDRIAELPGDDVIFNIDSADIEFQSAEGDEYSRSIEVRYEFLHDNYDALNTRFKDEYQALHDDLNLNAGKFFSYREENNVLILKEMRMRVEDAAQSVLLSLSSADFVEDRRGLENRIEMAVNEQLIDMNWPIRIEKVDLSTLRLSQETLQRVTNQLEKQDILPEQEETPIANVSMPTMDEFANQAIEFFKRIEAEEYSPEIASEMFCMYLNDAASREGRDMDMDCMRADVLTPDAN